MRTLINVNFAAKILYNINIQLWKFNFLNNERSQWLDFKLGTKSEFIVSRFDEKVEKCAEWMRASCKTSVQSQNIPLAGGTWEHIIWSIIWRNNSWIPLLPSELWYQRAVVCTDSVKPFQRLRTPSHITYLLGYWLHLYLMD